MAHYVRVEPNFKLSEKDRFGSFLINSLRHKTEINKTDLQCKITGDTLLISIPAYIEQRYGVHISPKHQFRFNSFLLDEFNDRMLDYVVPKLTGKKGDVKKSLLEFREAYGIYEDILPYKTLEKQWERTYYCLNNYKSA